MMQGTKAPALSIIVVSYNTLDMTLACLDSIRAETRATSHEVIVVDNASTDGSADALERHPAVTRMLCLSENIGFARANNLAVGHARGELLLLLNPDTVIRDGAVDELVAFAARRPQAMIWGGRTLFGDGSLNPTSVFGQLTLWRLFCRAAGLTGAFAGSTIFNGEALGNWPRDSEREVDIVTGCFLLTTRRLWQRLGGFDPVFFMYGEEVDFCLRARALGARPAMTPGATIIHYGGAAEVTRESKMVKVLAAKATLIERHFSRPVLGPAIALNEAWPLARWLAFGAWARVSGNKVAQEKAATWGAVWRRRHEWRKGYGAPGQLRSTAAVTV